MKGFALVAQFIFQPSRTYAQYDLAELFSVSDIDETMTNALASVDKSMCPSVASRELGKLQVTNPRKTFFIEDVAGFTVHNRNYETGHQLAKPSSVFSAEISAIRMALEHIQICYRGRYLILSDSLSSLMAMRSRRITCKTHPWVYESKQIYWDFQQLNYDVKLTRLQMGWPDRERHCPQTMTSNGKAVATRLAYRIYCVICSSNPICGIGQTVV
jgi:hypothetical protein